MTPNEKQLHEVVKAVVPHLPGWNYEFDSGRPWTAYLRGSDRIRLAAVFLGVGTESRMHLSMALPADVECITSCKEPGHITVSMKRPPAEIAREIERRLIPGAVEYTVRAIQDDEREKSRRVRIKRRLADLEGVLFGMEVRAIANGAVPKGLGFHHADERDRWSGFLETHDGEEIGITLRHLTHREALLVLRVLCPAISVREIEGLSSTPWHLDQDDGAERYIVSADDELVADCFPDYAGDLGVPEDYRANARVMVAAPDLYTAARAVLDWIDGPEGWIPDDDRLESRVSALRVAMHKAEGGVR